MIVTKATLASYFQTGNQPDQSNYQDLIDTLVALELAGQILTYPSGNVAINDTVGTDTGYNFVVNGTSNFTGSAALQNVSVAVNINAAKAHVGHLGGFTSAPAISAGSASGTTPMLSITGTDLAGTINLLTGTACPIGGTVANVTFNTAYATAPYVNFTAASANQAPFYVTNVTTTGFSINIGSAVTLSNTTNYILNYHVIA